MMTKTQAAKLAKELLGDSAYLEERRVNNIVVERRIIGPDVSAIRKRIEEQYDAEGRDKRLHPTGASSMVMGLSLAMFGTPFLPEQIPMRVWGAGRTWDDAFEDMALRR
jgi:hypothetical protein